MAKTILITGGTRGIGRAAAEHFARAGWNVVIAYRASEKSAQELVARWPGLLAVRADISRESDVKHLFREAAQRFGDPDVLVCCAGVVCPGQVCDLTLDEWNQVFAVNMTGTFLCCREIYHAMAARKSGAIVTVSSVWGQTGGSCEAAYSASKGAVIAFTKALAKELGPSGVTVNCVAPGVIDTDMNAQLSAGEKQELIEQTPLERLGAPEDVARAIAYLCEAPFVTGQVLAVNGGFVI